jgi:hypothetical protein
VFAIQVGQIVFGSLLVVVLLAMAGIFTWRQIQSLRNLRTATNVSPDEELYTRRQARRRLICSALMVVLAGLLAGSFALEGSFDALVAAGQASKERGETPVMSPAQEAFWIQYRAYWLIILLTLLAIIIMAGIDFMAIRRFGRQQYEQLKAARRAMIEGEIIRLRSQRNGHG